MDIEESGCPGECKNIVNDICQDCGCIIELNMVDYQIKNQSQDSCFKANKKEVFNYFNKLSDLDLDAKICANVCEQISRIKEKSHVRTNTRIKNLFAMIYIAFNQEGYEFNLNEIGKKLGMDDESIREAIKIASIGIDDDADKNPVCIISPFNFFKEVSLKFRDEYVFTDKTYKKIEDFINFLMDNNKMLANENPRGIAVTVLKMFFDENKITVHNFLQKTQRTPGYIKYRETQIIKTLNSIEKL